MQPLFAYNKADSLRNELNIQEIDTVMMRLYIELGNEIIYTSQSEALESFNKAYALSRLYNNQEKLILSVLGLCDVYGFVGEYKKGIGAITEVLANLSPDDNRLYALCNGRLATAYANLGQDSMALKYDRLSLKYNLKEPYQMGIAYDYGNIATFFIEREQYDSANYYLDLCLDILPDTSDVLLAITLSNKSHICVKSKKYQDALALFSQVLSFYKAKEMPYNIAKTEYEIAFVYHQMNKMDSAFLHTKFSLAYNKEVNNQELFRSCYGLLNLIYEAKKDYKNTSKYLRLEQAYADSVNQKNKENIITSINTKNKFEEQSKVLEATEKSNSKLSKQRSIFLLLSIVAFVLLITSVMAFFLIHKEHKRNKILVTRLDKMNHSMRKLLSVVGHDLRDSIGNLRNFTQLINHQLLDKASIAKMMSKFVPMVDSTHSLLETLLTWTRNNEEAFIPKLEQLHSEHLFKLCLEQVSHLALAKNIHIKHDVEDIFFTGDKNMILVVMRNIVCNAIKFSEPESSISMAVELVDSKVIFTVKDEGVGMTQEEVEMVLNANMEHQSEGTQGEKGAGVGLSLCNSFICNHGGNLTIKSIVGEGSTIGFSIPQQMS